MNNKNVFVTGASGFIGKYLIANLLNENITVYALTRRDKIDLASDGRIEIIEGDIAGKIDLPNGIKTIYHCAGVIYKKEDTDRVNIVGTKRMVEEALKRDCRLIHLSSAGVVGKYKGNFIDEDLECQPQTLYELTKFEAERVVRNGINRGLKAQILRPTIVFGIGRDPVKDSFLQLLKFMKSGLYKNIGDGSGIYNIIHANEVARAMRALDDDTIPNGGIYFINNPVTFRDMYKIVQAEMAKKNDGLSHIPYLLAFGLTAVFSAISLITGKRMPLTFSRLKALTNKKVFSQNRLLEMTSYHPLLKVEDYIKQVCKEYTEKGLLN